MLATSFLLGIDSQNPDAMTTSSGTTPQDVYATKRFGIICNVSLSVKVTCARIRASKK